MKLMPQSPTSIGTFETCPRQYQAKYITKEVVFTQSEASMYGDRMHKGMEKRLLHKEPLPSEFTPLEPIATAIKAMPGKLWVEHSVSFTQNYEPTDWRNRWVGSKIDICVLDLASVIRPGYARILDWKTGKPRSDYLQLTINAIGVFANMPTVQHIRAAYVYTKTGQLSPKQDYTRDKLPALQASLTQRVERIRIATETGNFPPQPSGLCHGWCDVMACPHNKSRK